MKVCSKFILCSFSVVMSKTYDIQVITNTSFVVSHGLS